MDSSNRVMEGILCSKAKYDHYLSFNQWNLGILAMSMVNISIILGLFPFLKKKNISIVLD